MASNYKMSARRKKAALHLELTGDFDGTSAFELIHFLRDNCRGISKVTIQTDGLNRIHPFGRDVFQNHLSLLNDRDIRLEFIGQHAGKIKPARNFFL